MLNKIIFYIFFLSIKLSLGDILQKLETYGSITVYMQSILYLSLDSFKSGDILYFETLLNDGNKYSESLLGFLETDEYNRSYNKSKFNINRTSKYFQDNQYSYTFYLSYTLKTNNKYLLILTPYFVNNPNTTFTVIHIRNNSNIWMKVVCIIIIVIIIIIIILIIIVLCKKRIKANKLLFQPTYSNPSIKLDQPLYKQTQSGYYQPEY